MHAGNRDRKRRSHRARAVSQCYAVTCAILVAGMAAEVAVLGYAERECAWSDLDRARSIARSTCSDDLLVETFLERELNQTIALLKTHHDALLTLTAEIVDKRYLSGGEVNRVINQKSWPGLH
jgi:hypothetical protein